MNIRDEAWQIMNKIAYIKDHGTITNRAIAMYLLSLYKKKRELPKIVVLSKELNISASAISKFINSIDISSYSSLRYIFEHRNAKKEMESTNALWDDKIKLTKYILESSNRILLIGNGLERIFLKYMQVQLIKKGYNVIMLDDWNDTEQVMASLRTNDVIFGAAISLSGSSIRKLLSVTSAKKIILSSTDISEKECDVLWDYEYKGDKNMFIETNRKNLLKFELDVLKIQDVLEEKWGK